MTADEQRSADRAAVTLWVVGNLTIDDVVNEDGTTAMGLCGGNAIYAALGARLWASRVGLAARVGIDFPRAHLRALAHAGVELRVRAVGAPSIRNWALYEAGGARRFVDRIGSGGHLEQSIRPRELPVATLRASACHIAPMPTRVQSGLVRSLAAKGVLVSLDPHDDYIRGQERELVKLLSRVHLFLPSRGEAALLYGRDDPERAAAHFATLGPRVVAIKMGREGSLVREAGRRTIRYVPAVPVSAIDPTGAGDAYCGGFIAAYSREPDALAAARRATVSASFVVERRGALANLPLDRAEAERRFARLVRHARGTARAAGDRSRRAYEHG